LRVYLVHHGEAVDPGIDVRRPLSDTGRDACERLAREAATRGTRPAVVWHSGKLRAKQTAEIFWRECHALAELSAARGLQPDDPPEWVRDRLRAEPRDVLMVGHFPHLPRLFGLLVGSGEGSSGFPPHGIVALRTDDDGQTWTEEWRLAPPEERG
jgi:phosphohistidine phosphatase